MALPTLLTAVDIRRAEKAGTSRPNILKKVVFPPVKFAKVDSNPGGGVMAVQHVLPRIEPLEPAFTTLGLDEDAFTGMGELDRWVLAGSYQHARRGVLSARCIIEAAISSWEPDESDPAEFQGCNHIFSNVLHLEFHLANKELLYVDFEERILRVDGVDLWAKHRQALGG